MYASGVMVIFGKMFRAVAEKETRVITTFDDPNLGSESYAMVDAYCVDPTCDCRRVMINVIRDRDKKHLATINWAFDPNDPDRGPFLDRLNTQSPLSNALLKLFKEEVITDKRYVERLERHYKMVKDAVADPHHKVHNALKDVTRKSPENAKKMRTPFLAASTDAELAEIWKEVGLYVPREMVDETVRRGARMVPYLGSMLTDEDLWAEGPESRPGWAPAHALMLLAAIGGQHVVPYATEFLRRGLGDVWLTEEGNTEYWLSDEADTLVFSLGPKGIDAIWQVVTDERADIWGRISGIDGLGMIGLAHEDHRVPLIARFRELATSILAKPDDASAETDSDLLEPLFDALACLHDEASKDLIERAYADPRYEFDAWYKQEIIKHFGMSFEKILEDLRTNPLDHFLPEELAYLKTMYERSESEGDFEDEPEFTPRPIVRETKVGRNDPCPCGSGKKYKKCCLSS